MNTDRLNGLRQGDVAHAAYRLVETLQGLPPELQVQAIAVAFHSVCEVYEVSKRDELERTARLVADAYEKGIVEFDALRQYLTEEVRPRRSRS